MNNDNYSSDGAETDDDSFGSDQNSSENDFRVNVIMITVIM